MKQKTKNSNDHLNLGWEGAGIRFTDIKRFVDEADTEVLDPNLQIKDTQIEPKKLILIQAAIYNEHEVLVPIRKY